MALLSENERREYFKFLGLGEYNEENIKKFQKMAMRPKDVDGDYGPLTDTALRHYYNVKKYTKNFDPVEFKCECNGRYCTGYPDYMKPCELEHIQLIRDHYNKPITVTSGLRCTGYNRTLAGSISNSPHLTGYAIDFYQAGVTDSYANRKAAIQYFKTLPNHNYTYGNGLDSSGYGISASYMGNALHTDTKPGANAQTSTQTTGLVVDGVMGPATTRQFQVFLGATVQDGVISGQNRNYRKYYPALTSVQFGSGGSFCIRLAQKWLSIEQDGIWGPQTSKAIQKKLGVEQDGIFGPISCKALQKYLNSHAKADFPAEPTPTPKPTDYYKMIDVSDFQVSIDWKKAKADGIQAVIVRCAGRGGEKGNIYDDSKFLEFIKGAYNAGLAVGIYFLTTAINAAEGKEEAQYAIKRWKAAGVPLDYPICIDSENVTWKENGKTHYGRSNDRNLSKAKRTEAIRAFADECKRQGYPSMIYASTSWLYNQVDMSKLSDMTVWCAQYYSKCEYTGKVAIWQYSSTGKVNGVKGSYNDNVDMDKCYIQPKQIFPPKDTDPTPEKKTYPGEYPTAAEIASASNIGIHNRTADWCYTITKSGKYHYVTFTDDDYTHYCPICTKRTYDLGWNCIGYATASWRHGGEIGCTCNCMTLWNGLGDRFYNMSDAEVLASVQDRLGVKAVKIIRNGNKHIPATKLEKGDLLMFYNGRTYIHMATYVGNGKISHSANKSEGIRYGDKYSDYTCLIAIRYTGSHNWLKKLDGGVAVEKLQMYLNWFGDYKLDVDGGFGPLTDAALRDAQKKLGVTVDGEAGPKTFAAMKAYKK